MRLTCTYSLLLLPDPEDVSYLPFLPLGTTTGIETISVPPFDDGSSSAIPITIPFPVGVTQHTVVYVRKLMYVC